MLIRRLNAQTKLTRNIISTGLLRQHQTLLTRGVNGNTTRTASRKILLSNRSITNLNNTLSSRINVSKLSNIRISSLNVSTLNDGLLDNLRDLTSRRTTDSSNSINTLTRSSTLTRLRLMNLKIISSQQNRANGTRMRKTITLMNNTHRNTNLRIINKGGRNRTKSGTRRNSVLTTLIHNTVLTRQSANIHNASLSIGIQMTSKIAGLLGNTANDRRNGNAHRNGAANNHSANNSTRRITLNGTRVRRTIKTNHLRLANLHNNNRVNIRSRGIVILINRLSRNLTMTCTHNSFLSIYRPETPLQQP